MEDLLNDSIAELKKESSDMTHCRINMIARQIYYLAHEADTTGKCSHEILEEYVNSMIYSVLMWEREIKMDSTDKPVERKMPASLNEVYLTKTMMTNRKRYYDALRTTVTDPEYMQKVRDSFSPRVKRKSTNLGKKYTRAIKIAKYDHNGNLVAVYDTIMLAAKSAGVQSTHLIKKCIKNEISEAYGFVWRIYDQF